MADGGNHSRLPFHFPSILRSKRTFLWQVSGSQLPGNSYLFGTMHVQDKAAFGRLAQVKEKILACNSFAVEFHLDQSAGAMPNAMGLPSGVTLKDLISPKKYAKLKRALLKSASINIDHYQTVSPFLLSGLVSSHSLGKDMPVSLDEYLWRFAKAEGKVGLGIETFEEQLAVLQKIPLEYQVKMLLDLGRNSRRACKHTDRMAALYEHGELLRLSKSVKKNASGLRKILLYNRNEIMANRIAEIASQGSLFAAVGAGHLGGGKGVIRLLKKKGLKLKPVAYSDSRNESPMPI